MKVIYVTAEYRSNTDEPKYFKSSFSVKNSRKSIKEQIIKILNEVMDYLPSVESIEFKIF